MPAFIPAYSLTITKIREVGKPSCFCWCGLLNDIHGVYSLGLLYCFVIFCSSLLNRPVHPNPMLGYLKSPVRAELFVFMLDVDNWFLYFYLYFFPCFYI